MTRHEHSAAQTGSPHQSQRHSATQTRLSPPIPTAQRHTDQQSQRHSAPQTRLSPPIPTPQRHPDQALPSNHNGTAPPRPGSPQQSQRHGATQTKLSPAISNHNGTAPPRQGSPQQSQRHSATQTRLFPAITTARRHPDKALPSNHNGTAPPRPRSPQQSQRHGATQTRLSPAIATAQRHPVQALTARRHPDKALPGNHNGTAPPRPGSPQQSQRHSATQTRLSPAITTARCHKASPRRPPSRRILRAQRIGHKTVVRGRARSLAATIPKTERTRSRPQTPQTKNKNPSLRIREKTQKTLASNWWSVGISQRL